MLIILMIETPRCCNTSQKSKNTILRHLKLVKVCIGSPDGHLMKLLLVLELGIRILQSKSYGFVRDEREEQPGVEGQGSMQRDQ